MSTIKTLEQIVGSKNERIRELWLDAEQKFCFPDDILTSSYTTDVLTSDKRFIDTDKFSEKERLMDAEIFKQLPVSRYGCDEFTDHFSFAEKFLLIRYFSVNYAGSAVKYSFNLIDDSGGDIVVFSRYENKGNTGYTLWKEEFIPFYLYLQDYLQDVLKEQSQLLEEIAHEERMKKIERERERMEGIRKSLFDMMCGDKNEE